MEGISWVYSGEGEAVATPCLLLVVAQNGSGQIAQVQLERHLARELLQLFGLIRVRVGVVVFVEAVLAIIALGFLLADRLLMIEILQVFAGLAGFAKQSFSAGEFL